MVEAEMAVTEKRERNPILHSFTILETLSLAQSPMTLSEIAELMHVHKTTVLRLLSTLVENGYVERDAGTSKYRLGAGLIALAGAALVKNPLAAVAQSVMDNIARSTRETVTLSVWNVSHAVDVAMSAGFEQITYAPTIGMRNPAHCTATGKIFLAALSDAERQNVLDGPLERYTSHTITDRAKLLPVLSEVKSSGVAYNKEEFTDNLCAIGVPVGHASTPPIGALVVSIPVFRFTDTKREACVEALKEGAYAISARLSGMA